MVNRTFNTVLSGLCELSNTNITFSDSQNVPLEIWKKKGALYPYFKDTICAVDGTHILAKVSNQDIVHFRNWKGEITQNVLAICTFGLYFSYLVPGWEGSAHDGRVLQWALRNGLEVAEGKYFLVDAGYALRKGFLVPYRGIRYHLREQSISCLRYVYIYFIIIKYVVIILIILIFILN